jgi:indolepyruvate ferredoxin oxidoreductase
VAEPIDHQSGGYAGMYVHVVRRGAEREARFGRGEGQITAAVVRNLHKVMAYKDEYEVARLFLRPEFDEQLRERFDQPVRVHYHLHPPLLRRLGRDRKVRVGAGARTAFRLLRAARRLRGTPLDPFGHQSSRREERALIAWYLDIVERATTRLGECPLPVLIELLELPAAIRGYEDVKSRNAARARRRATALLARLAPSGEAPSLVVHTIESRQEQG